MPANPSFGVTMTKDLKIDVFAACYSFPLPPLPPCLQKEKEEEGQLLQVTPVTATFLLLSRLHKTASYTGRKQAKQRCRQILGSKPIPNLILL